jgi:hypothetical protein
MELTFCSYDKVYVKNIILKFLTCLCYCVTYITLLLQSLGLREWLRNDKQNSSKMTILSPNKSYRVSVSLFLQRNR